MKKIILSGIFILAIAGIYIFRLHPEGIFWK